MMMMAMKMMVVKMMKCTSLHINVDARISHHEFDGGLAYEVRRRRRTHGAWITKAEGKREQQQHNDDPWLCSALEQRRNEE
jgi:hypothetical protein